MGLIRTVDPEQEPLSLDEAKQHLRVDIDDDDELILSQVAAARQWAEGHTLRALVTQTWRLTFDYEWPSVEEGGRCTHRIVLPRPPLASVTSVTYVDLEGATQTLAVDQYITSKRDTGEWSIEPAYGVIWPSVRDVPAAIAVTFVAGTTAADVPEPLKAAMKLHVQILYDHPSGAEMQALERARDALLNQSRVHPYR